MRLNEVEQRALNFRESARQAKELSDAKSEREAEEKLARRQNIASDTLEKFQVQEAVEMVRDEIFGGGDVKPITFHDGGISVFESGFNARSLGFRVITTTIDSDNRVSLKERVLDLSIIATTNNQYGRALRIRESIAPGLDGIEGARKLKGQKTQQGLVGVLKAVKMREFAKFSRIIEIDKSSDPKGEFDDVLSTYTEQIRERKGLPVQLRQYGEAILDNLPRELRALLIERDKLSEKDLENWEYDLKRVPNFVRSPLKALNSAVEVFRIYTSP